MDSAIFPIIVIICIIIGFYILLKIVKSAIKVVSFMIFMIFLIGAILGVMVYLDFSDIKENFPEKKSVVVLKNEEQVLMLADLVPSELQKGDNPFNEITDKVVEKKIKNNQYEIEGYYKTIIFKEKMLREGLNDTFEFPVNDGMNITKDEYLEIIRSDTPKKKFIDLVNEKEEDEKNITIKDFDDLEDIKSFKGMIFAFGLQTMIKDHGSSFLVKKYKQDQLEIKPKTVSLKIFKFLPASLFKTGQKEPINQTR